MKNILLILLIFSTIYVLGQSNTDEKRSSNIENIISDFTSTDWDKVYDAKDSLLNIGESSIPLLLKLMDNSRSFAKLENIGDLEYSGRIEESWIHGHYIDYDIDWIAIRAGWVLEHLTCQYFGFSTGVIEITEKKMIELHKNNYAEYIENIRTDIKFRQKKFKELNKIIKRAKNWWKKNEKTWIVPDRFKKGIFSNDTTIQIITIREMIDPPFKIKGYNQKWFDLEVKARIIELNKTNDEDLKSWTELLLKKKI